jgi:hypothetical protein
MKAAMGILGYKAGPARSPLANLAESDHAELAELLTTLEVPTAAQRASQPAFA